jgi:hypothetical protein
MNRIRTGMFGIGALGIGAALTLLPTAAGATPVTPTLFSQALTSFLLTSNDSTVSTACFQFSSTNSASTCNSTATTPTTGATLHYNTTATADFGVLKAGGTSSITGASGVSNTTDYSSAAGSAYFEDSWLITGGSGTGTLKLIFNVDGSYNFCTAGTGATIGFSLTNLDGGPSSYNPPSLTGCSGSFAGPVTLTTTFTYGTALDFLVSLTAGSTIRDLGENISSFMNFSNTAQMSAIIVTDAGGNAQPFSLSTASGAGLFAQLAPPPAPPTGVPEPLTLSLFGAGLFGAVALRRKRKI